VTLASKKKMSTTPPTRTPTTAHYNVSYAAYIPVNNVVAPGVCLYYNASGPPNLAVGPYFLTYAGDAFRDTYRAAQSVLVIPGSQHNYPPFVNTGPTRNYGAGSPSGPPDSNGPTLGSVAPPDIYDGTYYGSDEDSRANDCYLWNAKGQGTTSLMGPSNVIASFGPPNSSTSVTFNGQAQNPLEPLSPSIKWGLTVTIDESNPSAPTAQVSGTHTCYPAHNVKVNGTVVYDSQRDYNMPASNAGGYIAECLSGITSPVTVQIGPTRVNPQ
jgi:hypothetical protein